MSQNKSVEEVVKKEVDNMWVWVDDNKAGSKDFEVDYMKEFESHIRHIIQQERQPSQERERAIVEDMLSYVGNVYLPNSTETEMRKRIKDVAQKYNITLTNPN